MYAKFISETKIEFPPLNKDGIINYNIDIDRLIADGYKELHETPKPEDGIYTLTYADEGDYILEVVTVPTPEEKLEAAKDKKTQEAINTCEFVRENSTFTITLHEQSCNFDTSSRTQSDLQAAAIVTMTGTTYPNWVTNNWVVLDLTNEDVVAIFKAFFAIVSPLYTKEKLFIEQIEQCTTVEQVEAIVIDYTGENE